MAVLQIVSHPHMQCDNSLMITIPANIPWMLTKCMGHRFAGGRGGGPKSLQMVTAAMKLKDACSLEEKL